MKHITVIPALGKLRQKDHIFKGLTRSSIKPNQTKPIIAFFILVLGSSLQENLPHMCARNGSHGPLNNHAKPVLLALVHRRGTHALVEHVCLMPQLCVLAQMLSDHLHPLHLQPFQLLQRKKRRPEAPEHIPPGRCQAAVYSMHKALPVDPQPR